MEWIQNNWLEIFGSIAGFIYIFLEIKANKWMWPIGLITSIVYVLVFFDAKFYADMSMQFYYIIISIYGWYWWLKGEQNSSAKEHQISNIKLKTALQLTLFFIVSLVVISYILVNYTPSPLPYWDALTTALSIVATWMLARKIIEHWYLWVIINGISLSLYLYKGLYPTSILHLVYATLSIVGYLEWKKMQNKLADNE